MSHQQQSSQTAAQAPQNTEAIKLLSSALNEAQQSIRSYDAKAQICAIGYVFSLNIVLGINQTLWPDPEVNIWLVIVGWFVLLLPMLFFGYVLYPSRNSINALESDDTKHTRKVLYIRHERYNTVAQIKQAALGAEPIDELSFELLQSSKLRDRKRTRFVRALALAFMAFAFMFLIHSIEVISRYL